MRTFNFTVEIIDNDLAEYNLLKGLNEFLGEALKDFKKLPDTKKLYETDPNFKKMTKEYYKAKRAREIYINNHKQHE